MPTSARLKLIHAYKHLALLNVTVQGWKETHPGRIVGEFDADVSEYVFRVDAEAPPEEWSLLVGDVVHNAGAALDHLAWELVGHRGGEQRTGPGGTQFPIWDEPPEKPRKSILRLMDGIRPHDITVIETMQPYADRGDRVCGGKLNILSQLDNADKHRLVLPRYFGVLLATTDWPFYPSLYPDDMPRPPDGWMPVTNFPTPVPVKDIELVSGFRFNPRSDDGTEIMRVTIKATGPNPEMKMEPSPVISICFGNPDILVDCNRLGILLSEVDGAIRRIDEVWGRP